MSSTSALKNPREPGSIEQIVDTYGSERLGLFLKSILPTTTDPLSTLWTPENWRCWLDIGEYILFLGRTLHKQMYEHRADAEVKISEAAALVSIILCVPFDKAVRHARKIIDELCQCAWRGCAFHDRARAAERNVKARACKGCGDARYCGSECQRRDWTTGGHRTRCGRRLMLRPYNSDEDTGSGSGEDSTNVAAHGVCEDEDIE
ncbi:unnamed protein product [Peniophora sp. CBMAI 1063]|nr:unnamed protein product [Peniophora sp. CBMAI 1063]